MPLNLYKKLGETPKEALERLRVDMNTRGEDGAGATLSYAGRLDPMAEGVLLVLVGDEENAKREKYLGLEKEYEFDVLWGVETDTYDVLGKIVATKIPAVFDKKDFAKVIEKYQGIYNQPYPPYSSQPVNGKPLFQWAREGRLDEIADKIPSKEIDIKVLEHVCDRRIITADLKEKILGNISLVKGDFRQKEITALWEDFFAKHPSTIFTFSTFRATVTSGAYMRGLAHTFGRELGCGAIALRIVRIRVGKFEIESSAK
jgi:tRNA pseudouridine(55) synthase